MSIFLFCLLILAAPLTDAWGEPLGKGIVIHMQMGGKDIMNPGTRARVAGARDAAQLLGATLKESYSGWDTSVMLHQFKEALNKGCDCIAIMGHPGNEAFESLVQEAFDKDIIVTSGNAPLTKLMAKHQTRGFGYAGLDLFAGGWLTGLQMVEKGNLKPGDKSLVYGVLSKAERGLSTKGLKEALEDSGIIVDYVEIPPEIDAEISKSVPFLVQYLKQHPDLAAIGTQHGGITSQIPVSLKQAGIPAGEIVVGGIDLGPATVKGIEEGYITFVLDQQIYLQGFLPVLQCVLSKKYRFSGLIINTGSGIIDNMNIHILKDLISKGIR